MNRRSRSKRGWTLNDLKGPERAIAEKLLGAVFNSTPGTEAEAKAWAEFEEFDSILHDRDGWARFSA